MLVQTPNKPPFLQKMQWIMNPVKFMEDNAKLYPDIFEGKVVGYGGSLIFVNHPKGIQGFLTSDRSKLSAPGEFNAFLKPFIGDHSMVTIGGERHRNRRKLLMPAFHGDRILHYGERIVKLTEDAILRVPVDQTFSARQMMQDITLQIILEVVFGLREGELHQRLRLFADLLGNLFDSPLSSSIVFFSFLQKDLGAWSPWGNFVRQKRIVDELLFAEIAQRRSQGESEGIDILSLLMAAKDEDDNPMSDEAIRDELIALILAGYENTATALAWGLYWIHWLPNVKTKLATELSSLGTSPDPMDLFRLPYLTAVCHETLRIYPMIILTFPRLVQQPLDLLGYSLEKGKVVVGGIYLLHHREDLYPNPGQFLPQRFLERQYSAYEFMPFGGGLRRCLGDELAMFKMKLVLATVLSNCELTLVDSKPEKPQRRGLGIAPASGVEMRLVRK